MGASLALAAFAAAAATGLDGNPRAMLVRMALTALDGAEQPVYWAGWEPLAEAIGHAVPEDDGTPEVARVRRAGREAVRATMRRLTDAGIVSRTVRAAPGRNTRYALHLDRPTMQAQPAPIATGTMQTHPGNDAGPARPMMQGQPAPEKDRGETEEETRASAPPADRRCSRHHDTPSPPPCRACRDARLAAEAYVDAEAEADRARRAAALSALDPAEVEAISRRLGGQYSAAAIIEAARAQMPVNLPLGLTLLARQHDAAELVGRWEQ